MTTEKKEILFLGGSITICPPNAYTDKSGAPKISKAKVDLTGVVDSYGNAKPAAFLNMVNALQEDPEALKLLERLI